MGFYTKLSIEKVEDTTELKLVNEAKNYIPLFWIFLFNQSEQQVNKEEDLFIYSNTISEIKKNFKSISNEIIKYFEYPENAKFFIEYLNEYLSYFNNNDNLILDCSEWQFMGYQDVDSFAMMFEDINYILDNNLMDEFELFYPNTNYIDEDFVQKLLNSTNEEEIYMSMEPIIGMMDYKVSPDIKEKLEVLKVQILTKNSK